MGPKAFAYYFPVIDRFLRDWAESSDDSVDNCAWILACAMIAQMEITGPAALAIATVSEIAGLAAFVIQEADRYTDDILERKRLVKEWRKVKRICAELLPAL